MGNQFKNENYSRWQTQLIISLEIDLLYNKTFQLFYFYVPTERNSELL